MGQKRLSTVRNTFIALALSVAVWTIYVTTRPEPMMVTYMADDAFYYLVPAHAFAHGDGWTLDRLTPTAGFQILYGYVSAAVSLATGDTRALPIAMAWFSATMLLCGLWLTLTRTHPLYGQGIAATAVALTMATPRAMFQITAGLEWSLAIMTTAAFLAALLGTRDGARARASVALTAALVALTRADLSIFVGIFVLAVAWSRWKEGTTPLREAVLLCVAAGIGVAVAGAITLVNAWAITGAWVPNSIAIKAFWSRSNDFLPALSWKMIVSCTGSGRLLTSLGETLAVRSRYPMLVFAVWLIVVCTREWRKGSDRRALALASSVAVASYVVLYARGMNLMFDHYSAGIIIPMALLLSGSLTSVGRGWPAVACVLTLGTGVVLANDSWLTIPANRVIARHAPVLFAQVPAGSRVAGWNVGIASWKTGGRITNLDGLANAAVVEPIQTGTLACFLYDFRIDYLMDFGFMFPGQIDETFSANEGERRLIHLERNGYDSALLYRCTSLTATADDSTVPGTRYRLFGLDRNCVRALCPRKP